MCGTATCRRSSPGRSTATACTAPTSPNTATASTRTSCSWTRTRRPSRARSTGTRRSSPTNSATRTPAMTPTRPPHMMHGVVINPFFDWDGDRQLRIPYHESVIYEAHVKGLTAAAPGDPGGAARHLRRRRPPRRDRAPQKLGVTAIELMPVHQFVNDGTLRGEGPEQLLGLQHHRLLRPAEHLQLHRRRRAAGPGIQGHGPRRCTGPASR